MRIAPAQLRSRDSSRILDVRTPAEFGSLHIPVAQLAEGGITSWERDGGGRLAEYIPGTWLLIAFGVMMAVTAVAMLRGRTEVDAAGAPRELPVGKVVVEGVVVGLVTGLVGAGGGFLVVPALALLGGLPMSAAVGTSLVVISMKSLAGLAGYLHSVSIDWPLAAGVIAAAIVGSVIGERVVRRVSQEQLRVAFGWFVVVMAVVVLGRELPAWIVTSPITWAAVALTALVVLVARRSPAAGTDAGR
ncbi:TSUP family transporter [Euzebya sp.]|uniref:TSUP family transporter n=1 Tax=Euzebya sp. TaxID=1971409 RepID=UPI003514C1A5